MSKQDTPKRPVGRPRTRPLPDPNAPKRPVGRPALTDEERERRKTEEKAKKEEARVARLRGMGRLPSELSNDDNAKFIFHSMEVAKLGHIDKNNVDEVSQRTSDYFALCARNGMRPTVAGYALALGVPRITLISWHRRVRPCPSDCLEVIDQAYGIINAEMEDMLVNGKLNAIAGIFLMRNSFGYTNADTPISLPKEDGFAEENAKTLAEKYNYIPDD